MRLTGRTLAFLWLFGVVGYALEMTAIMRRARNDFPFMAVVWPLKIPIVLLALTLAYISDRIRRNGSAPAPAA